MSRLADSLQAQGLIGSEEAQIADVEAYDDGAGGTFVDADTIHRDGEKYRLKGFDAYEVDKRNFAPDPDNPIKSGDVGGAEQAVKAAELARRYGYTELVPEGGPDPYGRIRADLQDKNGNSFGEDLQARGVIRQDQYTSQEVSARASFNDLARQARQATGQPSTEWDQAASWIDEAINEQSRFAPQFKQRAFNEQSLAELKAYDEQHGTRYAEDYTNTTTQFRSYDRTLHNKARNPLSTSWDIGVRGVVEGLTGMVELVGQQTGWNELEHWAEGQLEEQRMELGDMPEVLTNYRDIEGVGDALQYVGNMAAISLPYMVSTIGAAALAPVTGGLSFAAPASIYAGQVWNEMGGYEDEERNPALAVMAGISMAALDRLGIAGLSNTTLLTTAGRNQVIEELAKKGIGREAAEQQLIQATRLEAAKLSGEAAQFAKDMLTKQNILRTTLASVATNAGREGVTEIAQETVAYLAAVAGSPTKEYNPAELLERIEHAAVGGFALGGSFAVPGVAYDIGQWTDVAYRAAPADLRHQTRQSRWREQEVEQHGRVRSVKDLQAEAQEAVGKRKDPIADLNERAKFDTKRKRERTAGESFKEKLEAIPSLWRGITRYIFDPETQDRSPAARALSSLFGGNLDGYHSGASYETAKHLRLAEYKNLIDTPRGVLESFGVTAGNLINETAALSEKIYGAMGIAMDKNGDINWDKLKGTEYETHIPALQKLVRDTQIMTDKMHADQSAHNPALGKITNYGFRVRSIDKVAVERSRPEFKQDLIEQFKVDDHVADQIIDNLLNQGDVSTIDDAFSLAEGGVNPASHHQRTLNLSDNAEFAEKWLNKNFFNNIGDAAKSAARYTTYQEYVGENNSKVNELFQQMEEELVNSGMDREEARARVNEKASLFKDYLDAESGNYKRPTTEFGRRLQKWQRNVMTLTTVAGLPLATLSSLVEFALVYKGLKPKHVAELSRTAREFATAFTPERYQGKDVSPARHALRETGFFEWDVGAATVTGATETTQSSRVWMDRFFKAIGLSQWTEYTRALRASFAMDFIDEQMSIYEVSLNGAPLTNEQISARDQLANIGINSQDFLQVWGRAKEGMPLSPDEEATFNDIIKTATFNWVNDAIVLPQSANRPLIYQNPQFALFTQFHGFISAFTANHLPKLYRQAFKGQVPSMKYNAFAVMATMIMLGFLSQYLKDLLKYGKTTPYLDDAEKIQRAVGASGLLGTGERVLNLFNPLYEQHYDTTIGKVLGEVAGESAAITNAITAGEAAGKAIQGEGEQAYRKGAKLIPIIGPFNSIRDAGQELIF